MLFRSFEFSEIADLFDVNKKERPKAVLQTFFYAMLYRLDCAHEEQLKPGIYSLRELGKYEISQKLDKKQTVVIDDYTTVQEPFETALKDCLSEIFQKENPFTQCEDVSHCEYCDFKNLCNR